MELSVDQCREIVAATGVTKLGADEARACVELVRIAVDVDDREDSDEVVTADALVAQVCALADIAVPPPAALPRDDLERRARLDALAAVLRGRPAGELAFAVAYLVTVADFAYAPEEMTFVNTVREVLEISEERAREVASDVVELVTPGE